MKIDPRLDKTGKPLPKWQCPNCDKPLDAVAEPGTNCRPEPGDLSVCIGCGMFLIFNDDLTQRPLKDDEYLKLPYATRKELTTMRDYVLRRNRAKGN